MRAARIDLGRVHGVSKWTIWAWENDIYPMPPGVTIRENNAQ
jgi:hypothetical protein